MNLMGDSFLSSVWSQADLVRRALAKHGSHGVIKQLQGQKQQKSVETKQAKSRAKVRAGAQFEHSLCQIVFSSMLPSA